VTGTPLTLEWFFASDGTAANMKPILYNVAAQAGRGVPSDFLSSVKNQFGGSIHGILDIQLGAVLGAAWNKTTEVYEALRSRKRLTVSLLEHEIGSVHHPAVDIYYGQRRVAEVKFEVELLLHLEGVRLFIRNGRIQEIQSGTCSGVGELRWSNIVLIRRSTRRFNLPGKIRLS
jgi:hypothetical protein